MSEQRPPSRQSTTRRRTYVPPQLVEYGSVSKLTQAGPGSAIEGSTALRRPPMAMCL